jgi:hypothetical protein
MLGSQVCWSGPVESGLSESLFDLRQVSREQCLHLQHTLVESEVSFTAVSGAA